LEITEKEIFPSGGTFIQILSSVEVELREKCDNLFMAAINSAIIKIIKA
jgi:hypothetical protein